VTAILAGIRIIEVAEHGFVPGTGALLAGWGAEVIKVEPVERGDAARGLATAASHGVNVLFQNANRGKQSIGLDLASPEGQDVLYQLVTTADVFLTNKLPRVRKRLCIDVDDLRAHNPRIVYVRGTGQGVSGPEADRGAYDLLTFWHRSGTSVAVAAPDGTVPFLPAPGFGDFISSMFMAGGVLGALYHRERTGESPVVDGSLLASGMWAMGASITNATLDPAWPWPPMVKNPLSGNYQTADGRWIALSCLQAGHYWGPLTQTVGRPDLAADPRFSDHATLLENSDAARGALREVFATRTLDEWSETLRDFSGQWAVVQNTREVAVDPQVVANRYLQACATVDGKAYQLVSAPVQFDGEPGPVARAPEFNEHGDAILADLGMVWETVVDLKVRGIVA
jgi:crotonobetainyl-CoA:carnitine CoA-transferase CaiB-like acyl-CoA transferase